MSCYSALLWFWLADHACPWLFSWWVAMVPCCKSGLLIMPVLGSPVSEWWWCLAATLSCWSYLSLALREWVAVVPCYNSRLLIIAVLGSQEVSSCDALLQFWPADHACSWLSSKWVAVVPCYNLGLLIKPLLGSPVGEWLCCLAAILACWTYLFLALQSVSGCCALLQF